jgi:transcriptional regulator with XRE-family HTH domain
MELPGILTFAERLKRRRIMLGISQDGLARIVGVHQMSVQKWESEKTVPSNKHLAPLSKALGVPMAWLVNKEGPEPPEPSQIERVTTCRRA